MVSIKRNDAEKLINAIENKNDIRILCTNGTSIAYHAEHEFIAFSDDKNTFTIIIHPNGLIGFSVDITADNRVQITGDGSIFINIRG